MEESHPGAARAGAGCKKLIGAPKSGLDHAPAGAERLSFAAGRARGLFFRGPGEDVKVRPGRRIDEAAAGGGDTLGDALDRSRRAGRHQADDGARIQGLQRAVIEQHLLGLGGVDHHQDQHIGAVGGGRRIGRRFGAGCCQRRQRGGVDPVYVKTIDQVPDVLSKLVRKGDLVITQGAGNVGVLAEILGERGLA